MASDEVKPESGRDGGGGEVEEETKNEGEEMNEEVREEKEPESKASAEKDDLNEEEKGEEEGEEEEKKEKRMRKSSSSDKEPVTPRERPARERKAVERYAIATPASRASGSKPLEIAKGNGTTLRDIPNVAFKLSKRKGDDNLQLLHTILYGKKAKAHLLKKDISQFSGFVWTDNEEKQRAKVKDKLDKCVKEKLLDFCDVLNIPVSRSVVKKEDLSVKLLEFLESPHATTELLLAEKDQKIKKSKQKTASTKSRSSKGASAEKSAKKDSSGEKRKRSVKADEDNETDDKNDDLESQSHSSEEEDDAHEKEEGDEEDTSSEEHQTGKKLTTAKSSSKGNSGAKSVKESTIAKNTKSEKSSKSPAKSGKKTAVTSVESTPAEAPSTSKGKRSKKQKVEELKKEKPVCAEEMSTSKNQKSKSAAKDQGKNKVKKPVISGPTNEDLRAEAVNILKVVDFNTATLSDILRLLGTHFDLDLMHRKAEVKSIITDVIENMSNPGDDEEDEDSDIGAQDSGED